MAQRNLSSDHGMYARITTDLRIDGRRRQERIPRGITQVVNQQRKFGIRGSKRSDEMTLAVDTDGHGDRVELFVEQAMPLLDQLHRAAWRYTKNHADAEDLVQETMLKAFRSLAQFAQGTNMRAWLFRILHTTWIDRYKSRKRRPDEVLAEFLTDLEFSPAVRRSAVCSASAELVALEALGDEDVRAALDALPEGQRMAVYYADVEGFRYAEIAQLLDIPVGTVMSRLHRGRRTLRNALVERAGHPAHCSGAGPVTPLSPSKPPPTMSGGHSAPTKHVPSGPHAVNGLPEVGPPAPVGITPRTPG